MVCSDLLKDTGIMRLLLVGLLLGSVSSQNTTMSFNSSIVSNMSSTTAPANMSVTYGAWTSASGYTNDMSTGTGDMSSMNDTLYCPSFSCVYSECYNMYKTQNDTTCPANCFCQLLRQTEYNYVASCSASCADDCGNGTMTNCSTKCCNSTGCLNDTFASMMMAPTTASTTILTTTMATTTTTTTTAPPPPTMDQSKKCHTFTCTGDRCYTNQGNMGSCSGSDQTHCQLKQGVTNEWTASCTTNCSDIKSCDSQTNQDCQLECCTATKTTSCLWLNGTLNVPNLATRGPYLQVELVVSLLGMLALSLSL